MKECIDDWFLIHLLLDAVLNIAFVRKEFIVLCYYHTQYLYL